MAPDSKRMVNISMLFSNWFEKQFRKVTKVVPEAAVLPHHGRHSQCLSRACQTRCQCFLHICQCFLLLRDTHIYRKCEMIQEHTMGCVQKHIIEKIQLGFLVYSTTIQLPMLVLFFLMTLGGVVPSVLSSHFPRSVPHLSPIWSQDRSWPHMCISHAATHGRTSLVCPHPQVTEHLATAASYSLDPSLGHWSSDPASLMQDPGWRFLGHGHSILDPMQSHMGSCSFIWISGRLTLTKI